MSSVNEETNLSLPAGHAQGGATTHDTSPVFQTGTVPDVEQEAYDAREAEREAQEAVIAEHEDNVARSEQEIADEKEVATPTPKAKSGSSSGSSDS